MQGSGAVSSKACARPIGLSSGGSIVAIGRSMGRTSTPNGRPAAADIVMTSAGRRRGHRWSSCQARRALVQAVIVSMG